MEETAQKKISPKYKRIVLKLSGEALRNTVDGDPIDASILESICQEVKEVSEAGGKLASLLAEAISFEA